MVSENGNGKHADDGVLRISTLVKRGRPVEVELRDPEHPDDPEHARLFNTYLAHRSNFGADDWGEMFDRFARMEEIDADRQAMAANKDIDNRERLKRGRAFTQEAEDLMNWLIQKVLPNLEPDYVPWLDDDSKMAVVTAFFEDAGLPLAVRSPMTPTPPNRQQRRQAPTKPTGAKSSRDSSSTTATLTAAGGSSRRGS